MKKTKNPLKELFKYVIKKTNFVDDEFYYLMYPEIGKTGISPCRHYFRYGFLERKIPNGRIACFFLFINFHHYMRDSLDWKQIESNGFSSFIHLLYHRINTHINKNNHFLRKLFILDVTQKRRHWLKLHKIEDKYPFSFREPMIIGEEYNRPLRTIEVPAKWLATIKNATVIAGNDHHIGGFQIVSHSCLVVCEPAANPRNGFVAGIHSFVYLIKNNKRSHVIVNYPYTTKENLPEAILISGRCSPNYFHWLIEYLSRAYIISKMSKLWKIPLIIDANLYPQEHDSLKMVFPDWPIFLLKRNTLLTVNTLHVPSISTYHPDNFSIPLWQGSALCFRTLDYVKNIINTECKLTIRPAYHSRKIFITRRGHTRNILNSSEVENTLKQHGFETIDPLNLTFAEQVMLFAAAKIIVGALGAAFSNLIFCQKETKVLSLCSPFAKRYCLQSNLARYSGCEYRLLAGESIHYTPGKENNMQNTIEDTFLLHSNFNINPTRLVEALKDWDAI